VDDQLIDVLRRCRHVDWQAFGAAGRLIEGSIPSDPDIEAFLKEHDPDVLVVTPLVSFEAVLPDYVKSAQALGIPVVFPVFSWDNLSNKGILHVVPDVMLVWNESQRDEAVSLHGVPAERIVVTGAPRFDEFFAMRPTQSRGAFCEALGLDPGRSIVVYLGSSPFLVPDEHRLAERWARAVREAGHEPLRSANLLFRPHPRAKAAWQVWDLGGLGPAAVAASDFRNADQTLFDLLSHADAAVAINTSAAIEAAILGTPVLTFLDPETRAAHDGTLHFGYLAGPGGCVAVAGSLAKHLAQLAFTIERGTDAAQLREFVRRFVRPCGETAVAPIVAGAIERSADTAPR
jgi:hypothetical protein